MARPSNQNAPASGKPSTNPNDQGEDTLAALVSDAKKQIKRLNKALDALVMLGEKHPAVIAAKEALKPEKEKIAKAVAQRVFDTLMKTE